MENEGKKSNTLKIVAGITLIILLASTITLGVLYATKGTPSKINTYSVTYSDNGKSIYTEKVEEGKNVSHVPSLPIKEGYKVSWNNDGKNITSDLVIYATYIANDYNVITSLSHVTSSPVNPSKITYDTPSCFYFIPESGYELPNDISINGASFDWNKSLGRLWLYSPISNVTITIQAEEIPEVITYCSVYYSAQGSTIYSEIIEYGQDVKNVPEVPLKDGYNGSWDHDGKNITSDIIIYAVYSAKTFGLSFNLNNVELVETPPQTIGSDDVLEFTLKGSSLIYTFPDTISVSNVSYNYKPQFGLLILFKPIDDVTISIDGVYAPQEVKIHCLVNPGEGSFVQVNEFDPIQINGEDKLTKALPGAHIKIHSATERTLTVKKINIFTQEEILVHNSVEPETDFDFNTELEFQYYIEYGFGFM